MQQALNLEMVRQVWWRRKWLAILVFLGPCAVMAGTVAFLPNLYRSAAIVLVERQQVPEEFVKSTVTSGLEARLQTISQEILSRVRLEALITELDLYPRLRQEAGMDALVARMRRDVEIQLRGVEPIVRGGAIVAFTVAYVGTDSHKAARVANTLASYYLDENTKIRGRQASGTAEFLGRRLEDTKQRLKEQERAVSEFKRRHVGESPDQMQANLSVLERLTAQLRLNSDNQSRLFDRRDALARRLADAEAATRIPAARAPEPAAVPDAAQGRLAQLQQELAELTSRFSDKYPDVVRIRAEVAALERKLAQRPAAAEPPESSSGREPAPVVVAPLPPALAQLRDALAEADAEIRALKAEERRLREEFVVYQSRVENAPRREQEYRELSRDYQTTSELYRTLLKQYEEAQLSETLEQRQKGEQFRLLEPAAPGRAPYSPNRVRLVMVGLALAAGLAVGAVLLAERMDTSFHTVADLRALTSAPVLARIPRLRTAADDRRRRRQAWLFGGAALAILVIAFGGGYLVAKDNEQLVGLLARGRP